MASFKNWLEMAERHPAYAAPPPAHGTSPIDLHRKKVAQEGPSAAVHDSKLLQRREEEASQHMAQIMKGLADHPQIKQTVLRAIQGAGTKYQAWQKMRSILNDISPKLYKTLTGQSQKIASPPPPTIGGGGL